MNAVDIAALRIQNQRLIGKKFASPVEVVRALTAVQSQDYPAAKWGIAQRTNTTEAELDTLFNDGAFLRTHVMRPTWHFVLPEDIVWIQDLTAPRVRKIADYYNRKEGLDEPTIDRANAVMAKALHGHNYLTRVEIKKLLEDANINTSGLRLGFMLMRAELNALICSGPRKGKQFTYALVAERAPKAKKLPHEEALARLTERYFASHGPAQVQDFAWWSGLTVKDVNVGIALLGNKLQSENVGGKVFWFTERAQVPVFSAPIVQLLPNYDESLIAYRDHSPSADPAIPASISYDGRLQVLMFHVITCNGLVAGGWQRKLSKNKVIITVNLLRPFSAAEHEALTTACAVYAEFLGLKHELILP